MIWDLQYNTNWKRSKIKRQERLGRDQRAGGNPHQQPRKALALVPTPVYHHGGAPSLPCTRRSGEDHLIPLRQHANPAELGTRSGGHPLDCIARAPYLPPWPTLCAKDASAREALDPANRNAATLSTACAETSRDLVGVRRNGRNSNGRERRAELGFGSAGGERKRWGQ